jgi:hypothetical protein
VFGARAGVQGGVGGGVWLERVLRGSNIAARMLSETRRTEHGSAPVDRLWQRFEARRVLEVWAVDVLLERVLVHVTMGVVWWGERVMGVQVLDRPWRCPPPRARARPRNHRPVLQLEGGAVEEGQRGHGRLRQPLWLWQLGAGRRRRWRGVCVGGAGLRRTGRDRQGSRGRRCRCVCRVCSCWLRVGAAALGQRQRGMRPVRTTREDAAMRVTRTRTHGARGSCGAAISCLWHAYHDTCAQLATTLGGWRQPPAAARPSALTAASPQPHTTELGLAPWLRAHLCDHGRAPGTHGCDDAAGGLCACELHR